MAAPRPSRVAVRFLCKVKAPSSIKKICLNILDQQLQLRPDRESETFFDFFWLMKSHWTQVWPDWAIFERSCWENCVQSSPNTLPFKEKKLWPLEDKLGHFLIKNLVTLLNTQTSQILWQIDCNKTGKFTPFTFNFNSPVQILLGSIIENNEKTTWECLGKLASGCGSVGLSVASYTRGPQFESSHRQILKIL